MNRIDNTHATFINCLRDWNDPFLHGHKPVKALGCQRCENSNCRYTNNNNTSANSANTSNNYSSSSSITSSNQVNNTINNANTNGDYGEASHDKHYLNDTFSKLNKNLNLFLSHQNHHHHHNHHYHNQNHNTCNHRSINANTSIESSSSSFQPIVRCKSSINVPKTIDQCIKLARSRPRPSSIRPFSKTRKQQINGEETESKTRKTLTTKSSSDIVVKSRKFSPVKSKVKESKLHSNSKAISTDECDTTLFEIITNNNNDAKFQTFNFSMKDLVNDFEKKNQKEKLTTNNREAYFGHERDLDENEYDCAEMNENVNNDDDNNNNINNKMMDTISLLSCSSSIIENDEINYDDSLQDNSFDSDR